MSSIPEKPTSHEEEYFHRQDAELLRQMRDRLDAARANAEKFSHFMKCPRCGGDLEEKHIEHVTIDVCKDCKGMWLDAGELDLIREIREHRKKGSVVAGAKGFFDDLIDYFWHHKTPAPKP